MSNPDLGKLGAIYGKKFQPGENSYTRGYAKYGGIITKHLRSILDETDPKSKMIMARVLARGIVMDAIQSPEPAVRNHSRDIVIGRMEGKLPDSLNINSDQTIFSEIPVEDLINLLQKYTISKSSESKDETTGGSHAPKRSSDHLRPPHGSCSPSKNKK